MMDSSGRSPIRNDDIVAKAVDVSRAGLRPELNFARSVFVYRSLFDALASPQLLGLSEEDLLTAWPAEEAVTATYRMVGDHQVDLPLLVPVDRLHWYNAEYFRTLYGPDRPVQYYTHAPVELDDPIRGNSALGVIASELERGAVIITDGYAGDDSQNEFDGWAPLLSRAGMPDIELDTLQGDDAEGVLNQFVGIADFGRRHFAVGPSCHEQFLRARPQGLVDASIDNGIDVVESITGAEAEHLWAIYEGPFDALSGGHALRAGFDHRTFMDAMGDPDVVKMVRRGAGGITTLCLFVADLTQCPWLNADFYEERYGDAFRTGNILVFTGMVSDEAMRGSAYASTLIHTLAEILRLRGTSCVITFECNSISSQYIPRIVTDSTNETGIAVMTGLETPVSRLAFKAISRAT